MNCIENKIKNASGPLKPTILSAILKLQQKGKLQITAKEVKNECYVLDSTKNWNGRLPAICNGMRNVAFCGWVIISEDRDFNDFMIALDRHKSMNDSFEIKITESNKNECDDITKYKNKPLIKKDATIKEYFDLNKIKDKKRNKLLLIGCSDTKVPGGQNLKKNHFETFDGINDGRNFISNLYSNLLNNPNQIHYFNKKRIDIGMVDSFYFNNQNNNNLYMPAVERYSGGKFFTPTHKHFYYEKNQQSNLHILIISGLYGILEFRDTIIDYQLDINMFGFWNNTNNNLIHQAVKKYIHDNDIENDLVFYSLSPTSYKTALKPEETWHDLWKTIPGGRSVNSIASANYLVYDFLPNL
jgi:cytoplasmic iron level regulating protein YaaA (DUF328/UPF0246 family)